MSSEVKRYEVWRADAELPDETLVVLASDHAAMAAELAEAREVLEWIAKWGYGDGGRECAEKAAEWLEKHGKDQAGGRRS